jgi:hypothetical protein
LIPAMLRTPAGFPDGSRLRVSQQAAMDAAGRVEISGCSLPVLQRELEGLALVM